MGYMTINGKRNTDWGMDFLGKTIAPAQAKTRLVDVPLSDGVIDITADTSGIIRYKTRQISARCEIRKPRLEWPHLQMELANEYNGQIVEIIFDDDPDHAWRGRCSVSGINDNGSTATINFIIDAEPFRRTLEPLVNERYTLIAEASESVVVGLSRKPRGYIDIKYISGSWVYLDLTINGVDYRWSRTSAKNIIPLLTEDTTITITNPSSTRQAEFDFVIIGGDL